MLILVDEAVAGAQALFAEFGDVRTFSGRQLTRADVAPADALVTRSVTPVNRELLDGSRVRFVGTTSTGCDQVDVDYLRSRSIVFASAAGCNAVTVSQYVFAACLLLGERFGFDLRERTLGIVGVGRIGSLVRAWARELGMRVLLCDPLRARSERSADFVELRALAREADVITLHVPLTKSGPDVTIGLIGEESISACKDGVFLINTSRGEVVDEPAILAAKSRGRIGALVLDVWRGEPNPLAAMVDAANIATPHIAGQSAASRMRASRMIRDALATTVGGKTSHGAQHAPLITRTKMDLASIDNPLRVMTAAASRACDLRGMDAAFRQLPRRSGRLESFDHLRSVLAERPEFGDFETTGVQVDSAAAKALSAVGFGLKPFPARSEK